jgi:hypothetical protein
MKQATAIPMATKAEGRKEGRKEGRTMGVVCSCCMVYKRLYNILNS